MIRYDIPAQRAEKIYRSRELRGIDLCSAPSNVAPYRSPDTFNMINDGTGRLRKRMGYRPLPCGDTDGGYDFEDRINGVFDLGYTRVVHAGTNLYDCDNAGRVRLVYGRMNDERSAFFNTERGLFILDGEHFLKYVYDFRQSSVSPVSDTAYVPTLVISRSPSGDSADAYTNASGNTVGGGGAMLEPINLICSSWKESFLGTASDTEYYLTEKDIDRVVTIEIMDSDGVFQTVDSALYSVDTENGKVTFLTSPGSGVIEGMDNVIITVCKERTGYPDRINKCRFGIFYGADGAEERLFLSGNPQYPGMDFYSEYDNYTYFPDVNYTLLSTGSCPVTGYCLAGNRLAAHLDNSSGKSIVIRTGTVNENGKTEFRITDFISGPSAVTSNSIRHFEGESLFFSGDGIYAITDSDLSERKIISLRSVFITDALKRLPFPEEACSAVYKSFYILSCDGKLFVLDGTKKEYSENVPKSAFQYECCICGDIDARVMWVENGALCFGDSDGKLWRFNTDEDDPASYSDNGDAIKAYWETPDIDGSVFFKNKTFRFLSLKTAPAVFTSVKVYLQRKGIWLKEPVFDSGARSRYISFGYIDFEKMTFSSDRTAKTLTKKLKVKKNDKIRLRFMNDVLNEPFGLYSYGLEFEEKNNYKG